MFETTRRRVLGASIAVAGNILNTFGYRAEAANLTWKGALMLDKISKLPTGMVEAAQFPLIDAIQGRRSRRFALGASIPDGPLAYTSKHAPAPLGELEQMVLLTAVTGNTGWSNLIPRNRFYSPKIPNTGWTPSSTTLISSPAPICAHTPHTN